MARAAKEKLNCALTEHLNTIHETWQVLDQTPASSINKVSWNDVIKMGDQISKQATTAGMLWTGEKPQVKELEENMGAYFNVLQGFLLLSHGSKVGAGSTLSSCIHASVKQVVDCSFMLFQESVSTYGSNKDQKQKIPQLAGTVWDACSALKKTPSTNIMAVGRALTQIAVSVKDVLREMKELKPASTEGASEEGKAESEHDDDSDNSFGDELGNDLSPEEMKIAELAIAVVSETLLVIKELIRSITSLLKLENQENNDGFVKSLERLLIICRGIGEQVDELGACLYPPQEFPALKAAVEKISSGVHEMQTELDDNLKGGSEAFNQACDALRGSLRLIEAEIGCSSVTELVPQMENLVVSS